MTDERIGPHDLSAEEAAEAERAEATRRQRQRDENDFKFVMAHKEGRRFMWRLLGITGLFRNPFLAGRDGSTEFRCGEQNVGQQLLAEIHGLCPERYTEMVKEQQQNARSERNS